VTLAKLHASRIEAARCDQRKEETEMEEFETLTEIKRPAADVFAALVDFDKAPTWNPGVSEVRCPAEGPFGVGSTLVYVGRFLGRHYESTSECTEYVPGARFASKSISGPFHLEVDYTLEEVEGATRLSGFYRGESRGFFKLAEPLVVRLTKRHFETANENLKELLEAEAL
jgi:uncharacterized protein YndB with AHSA1/START domain